MDTRERNQMLKVLVGGTVGFLVFFMIVEPKWRSNPVGVLLGSFLLVLLVCAVVYGRRGSEEAEFEDEERFEEETPDQETSPVEPRGGPVTIVKEREVIREIVMVPCKY